MTLIGLGYKARQGKNYVASYMKEFDNRVRCYAFADELKLYCKEHHNELLWKWQLAHQTRQVPPSKSDSIYGCTAILQWYGTDVARKENPNVWVEALARRIESEQPEIAVITDCRFENEAAYIKENGGFMVEVRRMEEDGTQFLDPGRDPHHVSETALDNYEGWDFIIQCKSGDLAGLKFKSIGVLNAIQFMEADDHEELSHSDAIWKFIDSHQADGFES